MDRPEQAGLLRHTLSTCKYTDTISQIRLLTLLVFICLRALPILHCINTEGTAWISLFDFGQGFNTRFGQHDLFVCNA